MSERSLLQYIGLRASVLLALGTWLTAYFSNHQLFAWLTVLSVGFVVWTANGLQRKKATKAQILAEGFVFGAVVVLLARLLLFIPMFLVFDEWRVATDSLYDVNQSLVEFYKILLNGNILQSVSVVLFGGLVGLLAAFAGRFFKDVSRADIKLLSSLILISIGVGVVILMVSVSTAKDQDTRQRLGAFLEERQSNTSPVSTQNERGDYDLSNISFEELEALNAELDQEALIVNNYDVEEALSAEITYSTELDADEREESEDAGPSNNTASLPQPYDRYEVKAGDTYACIAEEVYGNYRVWPEIVALNQGEGYEERRLFVGVTITLPDLPLSTTDTTNICD